MADLGLVTDARALLVELGRRFGMGPDDRPREGNAATRGSSESENVPESHHG
jgi:hypothetical protein